MESGLFKIRAEIAEEMLRRAQVDRETLARAVESYVQILIYVKWVEQASLFCIGEYPSYPDYVWDDIVRRYPFFARAWGLVEPASSDTDHDDRIYIEEALHQYLKFRLPVSQENWWVAVVHYASMDERIVRMEARLEDKTLPVVEHRPYEEWKAEVTKKDGALPLADPPKLVKSFPTPEGAKWESIWIRFRLGEKVRISCSAISKTYAFFELGLADRKKKAPNLLWYTLKNFARHDGIISHEISRSKLYYPESGLQCRPRERIKDDVKRLRKFLRSFFGLAGDPFKAYTKRRGWQTRFRCCDESELWKDDPVVETDFTDY